MSGLGLALDPNLLAGTAAFAVAALACLVAASASGRASVWRTLAVLQIAGALEVQLGLRYRLHLVVNAVLEERGWYRSRADWQAFLLLFALAIIVAIFAVAARRSREDGAAMAAIVGTGLAASVMGAEAISLHSIDALMYAPAGPLVLLGWMWIAACAVVVAAALAAIARARHASP